MPPTPSSGDPGAAGDIHADVEDVLTAGQVRRKAASGVVFVGLRAFAIRGLNLISVLVLARLLVPEDFGVLAFGQTLIVFGSFVADAGIAAGLVRRAEAPSRNELRTLLGFQLLTAVVIVGVVAALAVPSGRAGQVAAIMAASVVLSTCRTPASLVLERRLDYRTIASVEVLEGIVFVTWSLTTVALGAGVWGVATAHLGRAAAGTALMVYRSPVRTLAPRVDVQLVRQLLRYGLVVQAGALVGLVRAQGINLTTAAVAGLPVLGLYSLADRVMQIPWLVFESILRVTFPAMARLVSAGQDVTTDLERGLRLLTVLAGPPLCLVGATSPVLVPVLFGARWEGATGALPLIALGLLIAGPVVAVGNGYLYAVGDARQVLTAAVVHTAVWFLVAVPLLPSLGATAVGAGLLAGFSAEGYVLARAIRRRTGLRVYRVLAPASLALLLAGGAAFVVASRLEPTVWAVVQVSGLTVALVAVGLLLTARRSLREGVALGRRLLQRA